MLVAVIFMLAILIISLAVAMPRVRADLQRDREIETMQRGKQYARAIKMYYKKFNAYPPNIDALVKTNEIRFLRRKYMDPTTGKEEWKPIAFGQNKAPTAMGFFGQPIGGSTIAGVGPSGGNGVAGATSIGGSPFSSNPPAADIASPNGAAANPGDTSSATGGTDPNGNPAGGQTGAGGSTLGGQTFGGAGIIGFSPTSPKQSILVYKKKNHYNEWEFVYDPLADRMMISSGGAGAGGQSAGSMTNPISGNPGGNNQPGNPSNQ